MTEMATGSVEANTEHTDAIASSSMDTDESFTEVASIVSRLRSPTPSDLQEKEVSSNPPKGTKGKGNVSSEPLKVFIADSENFQVNTNVETLANCFAMHAESHSLLRSVISQHIKSAKHESGKACLAHKEKRERKLLKCLLIITRPHTL